MDNATVETTLSDTPLQPPRWVEATPGGGECIFLGRTRAEMHPLHGPLDSLHYEAYQPMARQVLDALATTAARRWSCHSVHLHHALGHVPVGEPSVLIRVVCDHRAEAFEACHWIIDSLKEQAPIWKQECWARGSSWASGAAVEHPMPDMP